MAILFVGLFLSHALPYFELLGVTPLLFMCALFVDYFGVRKTALFFLVPTLLSDLLSLPYMVELSESMVSALNFLPYFLLENGGQLIAIALLTRYTADIILLFLIHKALHKIGIYNRFQF